MEDYQDDPAILDEAVLLRRVPRQMLKLDEANKTVRPTSQAFNDSSDGSPRSVQLEHLLPDGAADALAGHAGVFLVALPAREVRRLGFQIASKPRVPGEPAHAWVVGKKTQSLRTRLAKLAQWTVRFPTEGDLPS